MKDIDKAILLYETMAKRCESSGFSNEQAIIYRETADFIKDCTTIEEAQEKIKNSKYYLGPTLALMQDHLYALERASNDLGMPELAEVYSKRRQEITEDNNSMYVTGYEQTAKNIKTEYLQTIEAFARIFLLYSELLSCHEHDKKRASDILVEMKAEKAKIKKPTSDIKELSKLDLFRGLFPITDLAYARFIDFLMNDFKLVKSNPADKEDSNDAWKRIKKEKDSITKTGSLMSSKQKRSEALAISPSNSAGMYTYIEGEVL